MTKTQFQAILSLTGISSLPSNWTHLNEEILYFVTDNDDNPIDANPRANRFRFNSSKETMDVIKVREVDKAPSHLHYDEVGDIFFEYHFIDDELQYDTYHMSDIYFVALAVKDDL